MVSRPWDGVEAASGQPLIVREAFYGLPFTGRRGSRPLRKITSKGDLPWSPVHGTEWKPSLTRILILVWVEFNVVES